MKFKKYVTIAILLSLLCIGWMFWKQSAISHIRSMNFEKDFAKIDTLFHKGDNWYWLISDYSRTHGYDLEFTLRHKTSVPNEKRHDLYTKVYEINNEIAGFAAYYPKSLYTWQFLFLVVDQSFRGQGVAKKLLKYAVADMVKHGAIKIDLVTRVDNITAQKLYKNFGFKQVGMTEEHVYMTWHNK